MSHLQKGYLASTNAAFDIRSDFRVDGNPFKLTAVEAAAGAFSLPLLYRVGGASPSDPGDWVPFSPDGGALVLSNATNPLIVALPGFYKLDLTGFAGEVFFSEYKMENGISLPSSSAPAVAGGSLSPTQPLPLAPIATFGALPVAGNAGDVAFVIDASGDPNVTTGGAQYTWNGVAWVLSGQETLPTSAVVLPTAATFAALPVTANPNELIFVTDASGDPQVDSGGAQYMFTGGAWQLTGNDVRLNYTTAATIAARDALAPDNGDFSFVTDASADPAVTAGAAFYQYVNGAWVRQLNTSGLTYAPYATIALRDAATVNDGDVAFVTDASADPNVVSGAATYDRVNGAWVQRFDQRFNDYAAYADIATRDADVSVLDGDVAFVTDASADPNITVGSAYYVRINGAWTLQLNASGLSYAVYADIATRDAAVGTLDGDFAFVTDASADANITTGNALYQRVNGAWALERNSRYNDYATYADITTRDAATNVVDTPDGDIAFVTDASADPAITAGSAYYVRINGLWVLQLNASGLSYVAYATIAARDAATVIDGDFAEVTDASADPNVDAGTAFYQRRSGAWVRIEGRSFEYVTDADIATRDARVNVENGDVAFVTDASADPDVVSGSATYIRVNGAWARQVGVRFNDYQLYADIATRDADANVLDGDWAQVTDASADPSITAGAAIYQRIGGAWVLRFNGAGLTYNVYADIATRDAALASLNNGDFAFVTNPTADPLVGPTSFGALYQKVKGIFVLHRDKLAFSPFNPTAMNSTGGTFNLASASVNFENADYVSFDLIASNAAMTFIGALANGATQEEGSRRIFEVRNSRTVPVVLDASAFPAFPDGTALTSPVTLAIGESAFIELLFAGGGWTTLEFSRQSSSGGLQYKLYTNIALRDAAVVNNGDIAYVTDASADASVGSGAAVYDRVNGAWVWRVLDHAFSIAHKETTFTAGAGSDTIDLSLLNVAAKEQVVVGLPVGTTALSFAPASFTGTAPGDERHFRITNSSGVTISIDTTNFPASITGVSILNPIVLLAGLDLDIFLKHTDQLRPYASNFDLIPTPGISYTVVPDITGRTNLSGAEDGDLVFVTDAALDPNIGVNTSIIYRRIGGAWQIDYEALGAHDAFNVAKGSLPTGAATIVLEAAQTGNNFFAFSGLKYLAVAGTTSLAVSGLVLSSAGQYSELPAGTIRHLHITNQTSTILPVDLSALPPYMDGSSLNAAISMNTEDLLITFIKTGLAAGWRTLHTSYDTVAGNRVYTVVADITARDALTPSDGDLVLVTNAALDLTIAQAKSVFYRRVAGAWVISPVGLAGLAAQTLSKGSITGAATVVLSSGGLANAYEFFSGVTFSPSISATSVTVTGLSGTDANMAALDAGTIKTLLLDGATSGTIPVNMNALPPRIDGSPLGTQFLIATTSMFLSFVKVGDVGSNTWRTLHTSFDQQKKDELVIFVEVATNFTATIGAEHQVDSRLGPITVALPASPVPGDTFAVFDSRSAATANNITVDFVTASQPYNGAADNAVLAVNKDYAEFRYIDGAIGWRLSR